MSKVFARLFSVAIALLSVLSVQHASAAFSTFSSEGLWKAAAGNEKLEDFESYVLNAQITALPMLGVTFAELAGGGFPVIYRHFESNVTPYGSKHLGNFPNGINAINRYAPIVLLPQQGLQITALGYYNGDGQAATMVATAYDSNNVVLGTVGAFKGAFGGFVSATPVAKVVFGGVTGDGWNHIDGLQISTAPIPEPSTLSMFGVGIIFCLWRCRAIQATRKGGKDRTTT